MDLEVSGGRITNRHTVTILEINLLIIARVVKAIHVVKHFHVFAVLTPVVNAWAAISAFAVKTVWRGG